MKTYLNLGSELKTIERPAIIDILGVSGVSWQHAGAKLQHKVSIPYFKQHVEIQLTRFITRGV